MANKNRDGMGRINRIKRQFEKAPKERNIRACGNATG
jgi:hypothetical protein